MRCDAADFSVGMKKQIELFYFFSIEHPPAFKSHLLSTVLPLITPTTSVLPSTSSNQPQPAAMLNIAFSASGLTQLNIHDDLNDEFFAKGQFADAEALGDVLEKWEEAFKGTGIHGVFLVASDVRECVDEMVERLEKGFGGSVKVVTRIWGAARPGDQAGHERMDRLSFFLVVRFD